MIWTVVLWLGMQWQAGTNPACGSGWLGLTPEECAELTHPPAEHVFEIRTMRDLDKPLEGNGLIGCREGFKFIPELRFQSAYSEAYCVRITRELYMDGVKLGTIKGLE